jgi:hypothetical protein
MKIELQQSKTHGTSKAISGWNWMECYSNKSVYQKSRIITNRHLRLQVKELKRNSKVLLKVLEEKKKVEDWMSSLKNSTKILNNYHKSFLNYAKN